VFAIFKLVPITLTLAGIAGFILSIGMAVDANILIFERMKEELRGGRSPRAAIRAGFDRAWLSIRDSNVSSLITCAILFVFGSNFGASIVAGFAITLAIGILVSLFTAIFVTRTLMNYLMDLDLVQNHWWLGVSGRHVAEAP
jgi:preprotein translocase subunit SecD